MDTRATTDSVKKNQLNQISNITLIIRANSMVGSLSGMISALLIILLLSQGYLSAWGQYGAAGYQYHQAAEEEPESGTGHNFATDERPSLRLGLKLRIPAVRIRVPRFNLPKVTVSAKIRQPDEPRVISLPEINIDTTSKANQNGDFTPNGANNYAYGEHKTAPMMSYGGGGGSGSGSNSQTFTFSTGGNEDETRAYGYRSASNAQRQIYGFAKPLRNSIEYSNSKTTERGGARERPSRFYYRDGTMSWPTYTGYSQHPVDVEHTDQTAAASTEISQVPNSAQSPVASNQDEIRRRAIPVLMLDDPVTAMPISKAYGYQANFRQEKKLSSTLFNQPSSWRQRALA